MKKTFATLITAILVMSAGAAFAASGTLNMSFGITGTQQLTKDSDLLLRVAKSDGVTSYNDADGAWNLVSAGKVKFLGDANVTLSEISAPSQDNLGTADSTLQFACRVKTGSYPTDKNDGNACSNPPATANDGTLYLALFPTSLSMGPSNTQGTYSNNLTVMFNY